MNLSPLTWAPVRVEACIVVPWPRYPTLTPGGKPSKSKMAGRLVPWLSVNVVCNMPRPQWHKNLAIWRDHVATDPLVVDIGKHMPFHGHVELSVTLHKATGHLMDSSAVLEGVKPLVDGLEAAGLVDNDRQIVAWRAEAVKAASRNECRVELVLTEVAP